MLLLLLLTDSAFLEAGLLYMGREGTKQAEKEEKTHFRCSVRAGLHVV